MRLPPIPQSEWSDAQRDVAGAIVSGPRGEVRGPFVPLLYSPGLAARVQALGEYVRFGSDIPDPLLEIAILMTARKLECAHIWQSHSRLAQNAGVGADVIAALSRRDLPAGGNDGVDTVARFCRELLETNRVGDAAFESVVARWGRKGAMELTGTCGYYGLLAMVLNVADNPLEPGAVPFAAAPQR